MTRNDTTKTQLNPKGLTQKLTRGATHHPTICTNCGGSLELVANRLFIMYKRARLPQPRPDAWVCVHCGWVEGDEHFQALLEERINHH